LIFDVHGQEHTHAKDEKQPSGFLARYELAVAVAYRPQLRGLARELRALKTERYTFVKGTGGDLAHPVSPRLFFGRTIISNA